MDETVSRRRAVGVGWELGSLQQSLVLPSLSRQDNRLITFKVHRARSIQTSLSGADSTLRRASMAKLPPKPDRGETSYKGSERLAGRKALITGGDSGMGRAAAIAYAREGADVAINYLPVEESDAREVIQPIKDAEETGSRPRVNCATEFSASEMVSEPVQRLGLKEASQALHSARWFGRQNRAFFALDRCASSAPR